jgi:hypothetical protein
VKQKQNPSHDHVQTIEGEKAYLKQIGPLRRVKAGGRPWLARSSIERTLPCLALIFEDS